MKSAAFFTLVAHSNSSQEYVLMSQTIPLTRGQAALVDDADYDRLKMWKWMLVGDGYAGRFDRTIRPPRLVYMHRLVLEAQSGQRVDHINGDKLDNRRENLRLVTAAQNQQNKRPAAHSSSGYKGVCWHQRIRKWHVRITVNGQRLHLGYYEDLETATLLYDAAARHFFGEYARPNYPDRPTSTKIAGLLAYVLALRATLYPIVKAASACGGQCVLCSRCGGHAG
jgi:hypothetical protein